MPRARLRIAIRLETTRSNGRHQRRNLIMKGDLLTARVQRVSGALRATSLKEQGAGSAIVRRTVLQAYPNDSREDGIARAFDRDVGYVSLAKHASSAECRGETLGLDRFRNLPRPRTFLRFGAANLL